NGTIDGWNQQARKDTQEWEIGGGQLWHSAYDPLDPLSIQDAHAPLSADMTRLAGQGQLAPILAVQASAFPQGRMQGVLLKGIDPEQKVLKIPTEILQKNPDGALIGKRMAQALKLKTGDALLVRW
ncbi:MAG TPA: ABC transporter permease, partial [Saprospiraceae bacterium]|nr:ABC transporter permease [Saprospiraceae bacterium]